MSELATKQDLANLETRLRNDLASKQDLRDLEIALRRDLASKQDLRDLETSLRKDMASEFARIDERFAKIDERFTKIDERFTKVDERFDSMEKRLLTAINEAVTHVANVIWERNRELIAVLDDKYAHLPAEVAQLRAEFDSHRRDVRIHARPRPVPAKRVTRKPSRPR